MASTHTVAPDLRALAATGEGELLRTLINSAITVEAGMALGIMRERGVPDRTIVHALNVREALIELPASPFPMRTDFASLTKVCGFTERLGCYHKDYVSAEGRFRIEVLGQGNLCYDIVLSEGRERAFLKPAPIGPDTVRPEALDLLLDKSNMLHEVIEIVRAMQMVFNPSFYMSVDDWLMEHAAESMLGIADLF